MTADMERYERLKKKAEDARLEAARKTGEEQRIIKDMEAKFNVSTLAEAKKELARVRIAREKADRKFKRKLEEFAKEFGEELD